MLRHLFQWHRHAMGIAHWFWLGDCEGFGHGSAGGHRSMPVHGGARSAAGRDPKSRLRGLSGIATTAAYAFSLQCTWSAFGKKRTCESASTMCVWGLKRPAPNPPRMSSYDPKVPLVSSTFAQEDVSGGIRNVGKVASMVARTLQAPAVGVEPLHSADICERPAAAVVHDVELEPGNVICCRAGRIADRLASHGAAVHVLPGRTGVMPPDRLVVEYQRCDRLPEDPGELAVVAGFALVDLRAFTLECGDSCFSRSRNHRRHLHHCVNPVTGSRCRDRQGVDNP